MSCRIYSNTIRNVDSLYMYDILIGYVQVMRAVHTYCRRNGDQSRNYSLLNVKLWLSCCWYSWTSVTVDCAVYDVKHHVSHAISSIVHAVTVQCHGQRHGTQRVQTPGKLASTFLDIGYDIWHELPGTPLTASHTADLMQYWPLSKNIIVFCTWGVQRSRTQLDLDNDFITVMFPVFKLHMTLWLQCFYRLLLFVDVDVLSYPIQLLF